ncbi:MAG: Trp family transcriptional regulator [Lentisphaeria bacterium]
MNDELIDELCSVLEKARDRTELKTLLNGLLTPREISEVSVRWHLMQKLLEGRTHREIANDLGISLGKIARGSRLLQYGSSDFKTLLERIRRENAG